MKRHTCQRMTGEEIEASAEKSAIFTRKVSPSSGFVTRNLQCRGTGARSRDSGGSQEMGIEDEARGPQWPRRRSR